MDVREMSFFPDESFKRHRQGYGPPFPLLALYDVADFCMLTLFLLLNSHPWACGSLILYPRTLDSLMCINDAPISAAQMLGEVSRLLQPGGIYMLITYGDPTVRMLHLRRPVYNWKIVLYIIPRPGFVRPMVVHRHAQIRNLFLSLRRVCILADFVLEDPDFHFIYVCKKMNETTELYNIPAYPLMADVL
ncbi:hypothetical protein GH714_017901 [Hevea brasiliensis]|uniref:Uncharacterized protein n=1 Tax=Hevea brasiliensis TaxID=3981 RepID=A0A6A6N591_HEVBR|nr:hypothetical protein GH714_017901 [Hevea brasiliensis]